MLEGNEVEGTFDSEAGKYSLDVNDKGSVRIDLAYEKDMGLGKVGTTTYAETNIFLIAESIAKKTKTEWDDKAVAGLKSLLGIQD